VDESQDFHNEEWKLIRALVPAGANDLFLVGDPHQRIYGRKVVLSRCGIATQGRSSTLRINYRTTENTETLLHNPGGVPSSEAAHVALFFANATRHTKP